MKNSELIKLTERFPNSEDFTEALQLATAVEKFSIQMRAKLLHSLEIKGRRGWDVKENKADIQRMLDEHIERAKSNPSQLIDVANLAMMLFYLEGKGVRK